MTATGPSLLLLGSGPGHLQMLLRAQAQPAPELRLTLVAPDRFSLYPAMLPELTAGLVGYRDCHIDLLQLCEQADAQLIISTLESLDPDTHLARLSNGEQIPFDIVSLDGDIESFAKAPDNPSSGLKIRPFSQFLPGWQGVLEHVYRHPKGANLALVGDSDTSVELALAIRQRLHQDPRVKNTPQLHLVHEGRSLLPELPLAAQMLAAQALQEQQIRVHPLFAAVRWEEDRLVSERGQYLPVDEVIWCQTEAPAFSEEQLGLARGPKGLIKINSHLQSVSHPFVFASGAWSEFEYGQNAPGIVDSAHQTSALTTNLRRYLRNEALKAYRAPRKPFKFIKLGERQAMLLRGDTLFNGPWVRRWKNFIDRRYMAQFPRA